MMGDRLLAPRGGTDQDESTANGSWRRLVLGGAGGLLLVAGVRRRDAIGAVMIIAGGWLLYLATGIDRSRGRTTYRTRVTVGEPPESLASFLREPDQLATVFGPLIDAEATDSADLRVGVSPPVGPQTRWTMTLEETDDEDVRWVATEERAFVRAVTMTFAQAPGERGTELTIDVAAAPPGGRIGTEAFHRFEALPEAFVDVLGDRIKSLAEAGEIPTTAENPSGRGRGDLV